MTGIRQQIVVGVDGSPESLTAARWAAREAGLRDLSLLLVHAFDIPVAGMLGYTVPAALTDGLSESGEQILADAAQDIRQDHPDLEITSRLAQSDPRPILVEASERAVLTVVGTRGGGRIPGVILGSVALHITAHGRSPVAVIPAGAAVDPAETQAGLVLLGVDGSRTSEAAVEFAFDEADRRGAPLRAVLVWDDVAFRGLAPAGFDDRAGGPGGARGPRRAARRLAGEVPRRAGRAGRAARTRRRGPAPARSGDAGAAAGRRRQPGPRRLHRSAARIHQPRPRRAQSMAGRRRPRHRPLTPSRPVCRPRRAHRPI